MIKKKDKIEGKMIVLKKDWQEVGVFKLKGKRRVNIRSGMRVLIISKKDQRSGNLPEGIVKEVLSNSSNHHYGIKDWLRSGEIRRVKEIISAKK